MVAKLWSSMILFICGVLFTAMAHATFPSVPSELYKALGIEKSATPKELHEAVTKRYNDPAQGAGKGSHAQYWEPIPMSMYFDPATSTKPLHHQMRLQDVRTALNAILMKHLSGLLLGRRVPMLI